MFLCWTPHIAHTPLQAPADWVAKFSTNITDSDTRLFYIAMVGFADDALGTLVDSLKSKGMYENTLVVFTSDNGGPVYSGGAAGANNYPLRGGKMSNFEGGIRTPAVVSGGWVDPAVRGTTLDGYVTLWDWYATLSSVAGVENVTDSRAALAGLPPLDSVDHSDYFRGIVKTSRRTEIPLGTPQNSSNVQSGNGELNGLIRGQYKLLSGTFIQAGWTGPRYPNASSNASKCFEVHSPAENTCVLKCSPACLFDIRADPEERVDLAGERPDVVREMLARMKVLNKTAFNPDRGEVDMVVCEKALGEYGGFWGPFVE